MLRPRLTSPAYHHVADQTLGCTAHLGVTTAVADFEAHLAHFALNYDVIDLSTALAGRWPKRPLLLTFDDSYRSTLATVAPILRRRRLPAVAFLNPDPIEHPVVMFDHLLSELASRYGTGALFAAVDAHHYAVAAHGPLGAIAPGQAASVHAYLNGAAATLDRTARDALHHALLRQFSLDEGQLKAELAVYLTPKDVAALASDGFEIGNHTASHVRCRWLTAGETGAEIGEARQRLQQLAGTSVRAFSFPYGSRRDATEAMISSVAASGHQAMFLAEGRCLPISERADRPYDRIPMDGVAANRLSAHLRVLPAYRALKDTLRGR